EPADRRPPGLEDRRRAHAAAEGPAAEGAEPVADLDAEALQLQLLDEAAVRLRVLAESGAGELFELGLARQRANRLGELPHRLDRDGGRLERERAAQGQADPDAVPAAEPLADHPAAAAETDARDGAAEGVAVLRDDGLGGSRELLFVPGELAQRLAGGD